MSFNLNGYNVIKHFIIIIIIKNKINRLTTIYQLVNVLIAKDKAHTTLQMALDCKPGELSKSSGFLLQVPCA